MKSTEPDGHDESLRRLLKEWNVNVSLPVRFQENVWRRIPQGRAPNQPDLISILAHWLGAILPRPHLAVGYVTMLLAIGVVAGWAQAHHDRARVRTQLSERYIQTLDPYRAHQP